MSEQTAQPDPSTLEQPEPRHVLVRIDHGDVVVIQPIGRREAKRRGLQVMEESAYLLSGRLKPVQRIPVEKPADDGQAADQGETPLAAEPDAGAAAESDAQAAPAPKGKATKTSAATAAKKTDATPAPGSTTPEEK